MTEPRNTINVPVAGSNRFEQDVVMAISRLKASVMSPDGSPSFANLSLTDLDASKLSGTDADKSFQSINVGDSIALTGTTLDTIQDIRATATPTFAGLTLTGLSGVLQATAGVVSGSATLDDVPDGTSYERVAANQLSSGIYIDATTAVKGIASFDSDSFSVADGHVSLAAGGGLSHNDLGSIQGGTAAEYYHLTETEHGYVSGANAQSVLTTAGPTFSSLALTGTSTPLYAGPWEHAPDPISPHSNIYGDLFVGNADFAGLGRLRFSSNSNQGFVQWNRYYDGSASHQLDTSRPSFTISLHGDGDYFSVQRSPAGSSTMANLLYIAGATGIVTLPYMSTAGFVKNNASGALSGGNSLIASDIPDLSDTYQPLDSDLTAIAGLTPTDGNFIVGDGTNWVAESGNTARTSLGLGTGDSPSFTQVTVAPGARNTGFVSNATGSRLPMFRWQEAGMDKWIIASRPSDSSRLYISASPSGPDGSPIATGAVIAVEQNGNTGFGINAPQEDVHAADTVRADTAFNLNGTDGITATDTVITALQDNAGQLQYKSKTITFTGGIRTATGAESGWTDVPSA